MSPEREKPELCRSLAAIWTESTGQCHRIQRNQGRVGKAAAALSSGTRVTAIRRDAARAHWFGRFHRRVYGRLL